MTPAWTPYRERAATLAGRGDSDATLFVRIEVHWTQTAGHLWWRRWSEPHEVPHGYMEFVDGRFDDWLVSREYLDEELADWSRNKLSYVGDLLDVEWLDDAASCYVRDDVLGLGPPPPRVLGRLDVERERSRALGQFRTFGSRHGA